MRRMMFALSLLLATACSIAVPPTTQPPTHTHPPTTGPSVPAPECNQRTLITTVYRELLQREPDAFGIEYYGTRLCSGAMDEAAFRAHVKASPEYAALHQPPPPAPPADDWAKDPGPGPWDTQDIEKLRTWRGAISTVLAPMPCGPRPHQPDNVVFTAQIDSPCWDAAARKIAFDAYRKHGYTHWVMGPMVQTGYHGRYPDTDWRKDPDKFFDRVEEVWREIGPPGIFTIPDNGVCATGSDVDVECLEREFGHIYRSPRAQRLFRIVLGQWEPCCWSPETHGKVAKLLESWFPHAIRAIHLQSNYVAPCTGDDMKQRGWKSAAQCWDAAHMELWHQVWLQESWTFLAEPWAVDPLRTPEEQFVYNLWDAERRIRQGHDDYRPRSSWGPGVPLDIIAFEYASYAVTPDPSKASWAIDWGRLALGVKGIRGFGDGGPGVR